MTYTYYPAGVCSRKMEIDLKGDIIEDVRIESGCQGNLLGIVQLVKGCRAQDVIQRLSGIQCGFKPTSCPDQLSVALAEALEHIEGGE